MGPDPPDRAGPGKLQPQGCMTAHREAAEAEGGGNMGIPSAGGSNGGSGLLGDRSLHHKEAEYGCVVYFDTTNSGPL